jgi:hypothetical protein
MYAIHYINLEMAPPQVCNYVRIKQLYSHSNNSIFCRMKVAFDDCNADGFIQKPFDINYLFDVLNSHLTFHLHCNNHFQNEL